MPVSCTTRSTPIASRSSRPTPTASRSRASAATPSIYFNDQLVTGGDATLAKRREGRFTNNLAGNSAAPPEDCDSNVTLWDCIWRDDLDGDGKEELYRVIVRETTPTLLLIEPYTLPYHWYIDTQIKKEWGRFWCEGSPAQDLQGLQSLLNSLVNEFIWGVQMSSRPPVLTEGWQLNDSLKGYGPGE